MRVYKAEVELPRYETLNRGQLEHVSSQAQWRKAASHQHSGETVNRTHYNRHSQWEHCHHNAVPYKLYDTYLQCSFVKCKHNATWFNAIVTLVMRHIRYERHIQTPTSSVLTQFYLPLPSGTSIVSFIHTTYEICTVWE